MPKLKEYRAKRDFSVTPEPPPKPTSRKKTKAAGTGGTLFMIHKHDASRLHYDLRLEMDGALASWAIPKGPSFDPSQKRLAVQTEDHPLEYGNFEGRIPDGEYGAGDSIIWEQGTYDTDPPGQASAQRKKGHLVLRLEGHKLHGRWHLVRTRPTPGGKAQWLFFKAKDEHARDDYDVVAEAPGSVISERVLTRGPVRKKDLRAPHPAPDKLMERVWPPMLAFPATVSDLGKGGSNFILEVKYDGYRGLAALSGGRLHFPTRNGLDLTQRFPQIAKALTQIVVGEAVIDGEVVALDERGVARFQLLMTPQAEHRFVAFDLLWLEGEDLRKRPLEERRELLSSLIANAPKSIVLSQRFEGTPEEGLAQTKKTGGEGLLAKRKRSAYVGGRSRDWLKLKALSAQELAIIGYNPLRNQQKGIGALLLGVMRDGKLHFAGKVGTGFSSKDRATLLDKLSPHRVDEPPVPDAPRERANIWVKPTLVAQVAFAEWTAELRLRHPAFQGLRIDKRPQDCVVELPTQANDTSKQAKPAAPPLPAVTVKNSNPDRLVYPKTGVRKRDVFAYYEAVAPVMVPALVDRPLTLQQWPKGIHEEGFYRQNVEHAPAWVRTTKIEHDRRTVQHVIVDRPETLLLLANYSALTLHMWSARLPNLDEPNWVVFDLDPGEDQDFDVVIETALTLRGMLQKIGLETVPKTSGKRGIHVMLPLGPGHTHEQAVEFAVAVTQTLERGIKNVTTERTISKRNGRLYLDAFQNGKGKTVVAPYSLRAIEGATVSTPLKWSEVKPGLDPRAFTWETIPKRVAKLGDLFAPALESEQKLPRLK